MVPTIETARLILRKPHSDDVDNVCAMWADPAVTRYITHDPVTRRQSWMAFLYLVGHWDVYGYGGWVVEEKASGAFVGQVGFQKFVRDIDASRDRLPEAGWVLSPTMHGRGYGWEAVEATMAWADANLDAPSTVAIVNPENDASLRVARRAGYCELRHTTYATNPIILFERPRSVSPQALDRSSSVA
jgi:RimJ/RimL family protein N-acetyltransferase